VTTGNDELDMMNDERLDPSRSSFFFAPILRNQESPSMTNDK
jgi:hypothetical protein